MFSQEATADRIGIGLVPKCCLFGLFFRNYLDFRLDQKGRKFISPENNEQKLLLVANSINLRNLLCNSATTTQKLDLALALTRYMI